MTLGVAISTPPAVIVMLPMGIVIVRVLSYYRKTMRELKRCESTSKTPIYTQFSETLDGLSTVRAYGHSERFNDASNILIHNNASIFWCMRITERWLSVRLEACSTVITAAAAVAGMLAVRDGTLDPAMMSLSVTFALSFGGTLQFFVNVFAEVEQQFSSVERVLHFINGPWSARLTPCREMLIRWPRLDMTSQSTARCR